MKKGVPLESSGLRQNCYRLDSVISLVNVSRAPVVPSFYDELESKTEDNCVREVIVSKPYPHTPESINSYLDSCDYRLDPQTAILNGHHMPNLGDVSGIQDMSKLSSVDIASLRSKLDSILAVLNEHGKNENSSPVVSGDSSEVK